MDRFRNRNLSWLAPDGLRITDICGAAQKYDSKSETGVDFHRKGAGISTDREDATALGIGYKLPC